MKSKRQKGIYFLPSLISTVGLFFGFYAIISASQQQFSNAALGLLIAMITDGLDGRIARLTNTTSDFGKEYDSLVDLVAFGLAPAFVVYFWSLQHLGKVGWLIAFLYSASTAIRLARFNTIVADEKRYFFGLPSPAAAAFVAFYVWSMVEFDVAGDSVSWVSAVVTLFAAALMVSSVRFRSFKDLDLKRKRPIISLLAAAVIFVVIYSDPQRTLFALAAVYALSGPVTWLLQWYRGEVGIASLVDEEELDSQSELVELEAELESLIAESETASESVITKSRSDDN